MTQEGFKRKLTAILSADVIGYSRLMRDDEEATVRDLAAHRVLITEIVQQHNGRVVDSPGDNILAEFASVVDAVNGAIKIQEEIKKSNESISENRRMAFRIGVNLGDVIEEEERIYGDGVNIAARVEGLAVGGGIAISGTVYEHIKEKLSLGYHYLGEQEVKNISEPVRVYRLLTEPADAGKMIDEKKQKSKKMRWAVSGAVALIVLVVGALAIWNHYFRPSFEPASLEKMAFPLPDKPSIAVLPFDNMSGDQTQEFIADGITESIITALSKVPSLFVIARNSSFTYKGKPVKVQQVSQELGIRYVLEGSVQKSGDRIRINAQLIDAIKGHHLWAEKYDRKFEDIFALQDDITLNILKELQLELIGLDRASTIGTNNPEAYLKYLKGLYHLFRWNKVDNEIAREYFEEAIALDPNYAAAYQAVGETYYAEVWGFYSEDYKESISKVANWAQKTLTLDASNPGGHSLMATVYKMSGQMDKAIAEGEKAIELNPNGADTLFNHAEVLRIANQPEEALKLMEKVMRLNPKPQPWYYWQLGAVYHILGRYDDAIAAYEPVFNYNIDYMSFIAHVGMAFACLELEKEDKAREHAAAALKLRDVSLAMWAVALLQYKDHEYLKRLMKPLESNQHAGAGKREVYVYEGTPAFKFEYPAGSVIEKELPNPILSSTVLHIKTVNGAYIAASVLDDAGDLSLADFGPKYYVQQLIDIGRGSNVKIISNAPFVLKDGTKAYRTEFEYLLSTGVMRIAVVIVSALKDEKIVSLDIHTTVGAQSDVAWIVESLTFE